MPVYLYCAIPAATDPPPAALRGIDDRPVRALTAGAVAAWVSDVADRVVSPSIARARAHDAVVRSAMAGVTPVPARFGQVSPTNEQLSAWLGGRSEALLGALEAVRGCVEITLRILLADPGEAVEAPPRESGVAYLRWLRDRQQTRQWVLDQAEFLRGRVARALEGQGVVRDAVWAAPAPSARSLEAAHLVPRDAVARHRAVVRGVIEAEHGFRLMLSGPWAPYTFCAALHD